MAVSKPGKQTILSKNTQLYQKAGKQAASLPLLEIILHSQAELLIGEIGEVGCVALRMLTLILVLMPTKHITEQ